MKVYMDDARMTPDGWVRTYTVTETIELLKTRQVTVLSLDNDLGDLDPKTEGFNVLNFLDETAYFDETFPIPELFVHSSNEGRAPMMRMVIQKLNEIRMSRINDVE